MSNAPKCICGNHKKASSSLVSENNNRGLETSFIHLALPSCDERHAPHNESHEGFLETVRHASALLRAGQGKALPENDRDSGVSLCQDCIERVIRAIDADTERLEDERVAYDKAVTDEKERQDKIRKALIATRWSSSSTEYGQDVESMIQETEASFLDEISALNAACEQHEQELRHLQSLQKEQITVSQELDRIGDCLEDQRNSLQLEARAFGHVHHEFANKLRDTENEVQALSSVKIHSALFNLFVDKRGLRYPLINDLRLAYSPKGDVDWAEINAGWSQVLQLMLLIAASINFRSKDWRIVPLTACAKLIYLDGKHREVYNLGGSGRDGNMSVGLRALNALLDQICRHMSGLLQEIEGEAPALPFDITRNRIGTSDLSHLEPLDDKEWSRVIHYMASNLQWLSTCASEYELQNVTFVV